MVGISIKENLIKSLIYKWFYGLDNKNLESFLECLNDEFVIEYESIHINNIFDINLFFNNYFNMYKKTYHQVKDIILKKENGICKAEVIIKSKYCNDSNEKTHNLKFDFYLFCEHNSFYVYKCIIKNI